MNPWDVLCISPTSDEATVRQAYAKLVKSRRPDDDMQAFQDLRSAYEQAQAVCRARKSTDTHIFRPDYGNAQEETQPLPDLQLTSQKKLHPLPNVHSPVRYDTQPAPNWHLPNIENDFVLQFEALAKDHSSYLHQSKWLALLNRAYDMNYWERRSLGEMMAFKLGFIPFLPSFVWTKLEEIFNWEQYRGHLESQYSEDQLNWLKREGEIARLLCPEEIITCKGSHEYLRDTKDFYIRRKGMTAYSTRFWFRKVFLERDELPAALRLRFSLLKSIGDWKTLSTPDKVFEGNTNHLFISLLRSEALRHSRDYAGALNIYEDILKQHPNHADALRWSALCMERLGDASLALERYRLVLDILPDDVYSLCAVKRLAAVPAGKHRSWRNQLFRIGGALGKALPLKSSPR